MGITSDGEKNPPQRGKNGVNKRRAVGRIEAGSRLKKQRVLGSGFKAQGSRNFGSRFWVQGSGLWKVQEDQGSFELRVASFDGYLIGLST